MELLLNFLWLMLALPALAIWRQHHLASRRTKRPHHFRSFLLLSCLLILLFPAVSISDDLHPISAEIEESGPFKRTIKQSAGAKSPTHAGMWAILAVQMACCPPEPVLVGGAAAYVSNCPRRIPFTVDDNRGPPRA